MTSFTQEALASYIADKPHEHYEAQNNDSLAQDYNPWESSALVRDTTEPHQMCRNQIYELNLPSLTATCKVPDSTLRKEKARSEFILYNTSEDNLRREIKENSINETGLEGVDEAQDHRITALEARNSDLEDRLVAVVATFDSLNTAVTYLAGRDWNLLQEKIFQAEQLYIQQAIEIEAEREALAAASAQVVALDSKVGGISSDGYTDQQGAIVSAMGDNSSTISAGFMTFPEIEQQAISEDFYENNQEVQTWDMLGDDAVFHEFCIPTTASVEAFFNLVWKEDDGAAVTNCNYQVIEDGDKTLVAQSRALASTGSNIQVGFRSRGHNIFYEATAGADNSQTYQLKCVPSNFAPTTATSEVGALQYGYKVYKTLESDAVNAVSSDAPACE